jgi:hypothetical protein
VFEVLEKAFIQNTYIFASLRQALQNSSAFANEVPSEAVSHIFPSSLKFLH